MATIPLHERHWVQPTGEGKLGSLETDGFALKLGSFGKFSVRRKPGICRKIGFNGHTIQTKPLRKVKFISLGTLRQQARVD